MKTTGILLVALVLISGGFALTLGPFPSTASNDPVFYNELGYMLVQEGRMTDAQDAFAMAVSLDATYDNARKNLYVAAFQNEDYLTAEEHVRYLLATDETAQYQFDLAQVLVARARFDAVDGNAAVVTLEEAISLLDAAGDYQHAVKNLEIVRNVLANI